MNIAKLAREHGLPYKRLWDRIHVQKMPLEVALTKPLPRRKVLEAEWNMPLMDILNVLAARGMTRRQAADELGLNCDHMNAMVAASDEECPWERVDVVANWVRDTGEPFGDALRRMAAQGYTLTEAAIAVGYSDCTGLINCMKARDLVVDFPRRTRAPKPYREPVVPMYRRGPPSGEEHPWRREAKRKFANEVS